jgi:hypothetical protein
MTVALAYGQNPQLAALAESLASQATVTRLLLVGPRSAETTAFSTHIRAKTQVVQGDFFSGAAINHILGAAADDYVLILSGERIELERLAIERMLSVAKDSGAGLVYSDFRDVDGGQVTDHPLIDYQLGSIRDNFDFGAMILLSKAAVDAAIRSHGPVSEQLHWAGLYDLRLKLSVGSTLLRIPEPLYMRIPNDQRSSSERQFDYVDPRQRDYQLEMEQVATEH